MGDWLRKGEPTRHGIHKRPARTPVIGLGEKGNAYPLFWRTVVKDHYEDFRPVPRRRLYRHPAVGVWSGFHVLRVGGHLGGPPWLAEQVGAKLLARDTGELGNSVDALARNTHPLADRAMRDFQIIGQGFEPAAFPVQPFAKLIHAMTLVWLTRFVNPKSLAWLHGRNFFCGG